MKVFNSISSYVSQKQSIITIGTFDGVHIGHQEIIEKIIEDAKKSDCESLILTFFPHPRMVLAHESGVKLLNTINEKIELLEKIGLSDLIIHPFDETFSQLSAEEFVVKILVEKLKIKKIILGHDHRFGKDRSASIDDLIIFGKKYNFEVEQISAQEIDRVAISSTKIRTALLEGNIVLANQYLGYQYFFSGKVVKGKQLGRTIGFPTANIQVDEEYKLIPKNGVYIVKSSIDEKIHFGMMNIGTRPTVDGKNLTIEVYFFDFDKDIYDTSVTVTILDRIRDEKKFDSFEDLKEQLKKDRIKVMEIAYR
ncbi:MAG: bifunctional riboflavin kinase/FAD synthetase [Flavobacterium sp.]|uniref:bifunctional riboflavin kinase/FAD synthetase n=1 Tax=Flavobacterium sp. TaxID=239 RepID=UPI0022C36BC7|nr:bifunctional riboflavin kinase/FAD synthetase [Flavobacterium sp.]MCZ8197511.1 bifunctional riboflavin kinase/FAD synthetase [Flavobacterium sp.]